MVQTVADDGGRIPMSPALQASLMRARDYASHQAHAQVTLEHLLLSLTEDDDAAVVLQACRVDLQRLRNDVAGTIGAPDDRPTGNGPSEPGISAGLTQILKYATLAAKQGRRPRIDGAIVLAAIVGEGRSMAAAFLKAQGLTFEEAIRALQQVGGPAGRAPVTGGVETSPAAIAGHDAAAMPSGMAPPAHNAAVEMPSRSEPIVANTEDILAVARARVESRGLQARLDEAPVSKAGGGSGPSRAQSDEPPDDSAPAGPVAAAVQPSPVISASAPTWSPPPLPVMPRPSAKPRGARPPVLPPAGPPSLSESPPAGEVGAQPNAWAGHGDGAAAPRAPRPAASAQSPVVHNPPPPQRPIDSGFAAPPRPPLPNGAARGEFPAPAMADSVQVTHSIPTRLTVHDTANVEVRVARPVAAGAPRRCALSVRLRSADGALVVAANAPETFWEKAPVPGRPTGEVVIWRFNLIAMQSGASGLQLLVGSHSVGPDGLGTETTVYDQKLGVRITASKRRTAVRVSKAALVGLASVAVVALVEYAVGIDLLMLLRLLAR